MRVKFYTFFTLLSLLCGMATGRGQMATPPAQDTGKTYAMIIGISDYKFIRPLTYADRDAELFRDFLKSTGGGHLQEENIFCLLNEEAKAANFWIKGMNWLRSKNMQNGDRLYIYMAGHGDAINQDEYFFLTYDCNPAGDKNNYIVTGNIQLYNLKSRIAELTRNGIEVYLIMDACRSNELPGGTDGQQILNAAISEKRSGEVIMLATGAGQESFEHASIGSGHGLFTYYLVDGLSGYADAAGNSDKVTSLKEIETYVNQNVPVIAEQKYQKKQNPFICCADSLDKYVANVDTSFFTKWGLVKQLKNLSGSEIDAMSRSIAARGLDGVAIDSNFLENYSKFRKALKRTHLTGSDSSAEHYFLVLQQLEPASPYTKDARLTLAAEFVNFAQTKINLYLHGKDEATIQQIRSQLDDNEQADELNTSLERMEKIARQDFSQTGTLLEKAIGYLEPADSLIAKQLAGKVYFFKAHGYFDKGNKTLDHNEAMRYARMAYAVDPNAAYVLNTISSLFLQNKRFDSAIYYANQASVIAPMWRLPYLNIAYAFNKLNVRDSALTYYKKAVFTDQANADAYVDLGRFYYNIRQVDSAVHYYQKALGIDYTNVYAHNNMGWILKEQRNYKDAISSFKNSIHFNPGFFNSYNGLSKVFSEMKQYDSARYYYQQALQQYPDKIITTNYLGNFYKSLKLYDSALVYYKEAIAYDNKDNVPLINIGRLYEDQRNYDSAITYYNKAAATNLYDHKVLNQIGSLYRHMKKFDSSRLFFQKSFQLNNYYTTAINNLALTYQDERRFDSAIFYYQRAAALEPGNASIYNNMGAAFKELRKVDSARIYFDKSIAINPVNLSPYTNMGWLYREQRKYDSAKIYFKSGVYQNPGNMEALNNLMNLFKYINEYDSVRTYYWEIIKANPGNPALVNNLGIFYFDVKGFDSAISLYKQAIVIDPEYTVAYNNLGTVYNEVAFYDSAIYYYKQAIALDPQYTNAYFNLGMSFHNKGKFDSSIVYLKKAIDLNPNAPYYDYFISCAYAMKKQQAESISHLHTAIKKGYNDFYTILHDADLDYIRKSKEYADLVKEFVPQKYINQLEEEKRKEKENAIPPPPPDKKKKGKND